MKAAVSLLLSLSWLLPQLAAAQAPVSPDAPDEIVVTGRQPGPPLWRVVNGDHVLWIFPQLAPVPKDMVWDSDKVAAVIAQSQEALDMPDIGADISPRLYLNPINLFRGARLAKRLSSDASGRTLAQTLPPDVHARFQALGAKYFPKDAGELEALRPAFAAGRMVGIVESKEGLGGDAGIMKTIDKLIRRSDAKRTEIKVDVDLKGGFGDLAERAEAMLASLDPALELQCFENQLARMENDIDEMRQRANTWARGYIDQFRGVVLTGSDEDTCLALIVASSERDTIEATRAKLENLWLDNAERALRANRGTFAILPIAELLRPDGPIAKLRAKNYDVREP
ncbi:MAG TPA: TraB/GumN family protein [Gammaproteobacteria bacterium]|nr:TraB/GumN family protein [Gammaproteobacteria bacterium]